MTIEQAEKKWNVKSATILKYIEKGLIDNLSCKNNILILPDIPKPYIIKNGSNKTVEDAYRHILKACNKKQYIDCFLLNISEEEFVTYRDSLVAEKLLEKIKNAKVGTSNMGYIITQKGINAINTKKNIDITLFNLSPKVGLINV